MPFKGNPGDNYDNFKNVKTVHNDAGNDIFIDIAEKYSVKKSRSEIVLLKLCTSKWFAEQSYGTK